VTETGIKTYQNSSKLIIFLFKTLYITSVNKDFGMGTRCSMKSRLPVVICSTLSDLHSLQNPYSGILWGSSAFVQSCNSCKVAAELNCQAVVHQFICSLVYCSVSFTFAVLLARYIHSAVYHFYLLSLW